MTETTTTMNREEFEQHHSRTWDYVARVDKIWEGIAEEQQAIVDGKGYRHLGYRTHEEYWTGEFQEKTGWLYTNIKQWMHARRTKITTPESPGRTFEPGPRQWSHLGVLTPEERVDLLDNYELYRPDEKGISQPVRQAIRKYKDEPTVRDMLTPDVMADLPSGKFDEFENWASETSKLVGPIHRMQPREVADACERLYPEKIERHIAWADEIAQWYGAYRDELVARQRQGIRAVK